MAKSLPRDYQAACPAVLSGIAIAKTLPPIHEGQCGLQTPLSLSAVTANGRTIELNAPVTTDCGMATALPAWIGEVDSYITAKEKTRIKKRLVGERALRDLAAWAAGTPALAAE